MLYYFLLLESLSQRVFPIKFIENFIHVSSIFLFPPPLLSPPHSSQLQLPLKPVSHTNVIDSYCKEPDIDCMWV